jgi:hypothetical protein
LNKQNIQEKDISITITCIPRKAIPGRLILKLTIAFVTSLEKYLLIISLSATKYKIRRTIVPTIHDIYEYFILNKTPRDMNIEEMEENTILAISSLTNANIDPIERNKRIKKLNIFTKKT